MNGLSAAEFVPRMAQITGLPEATINGVKRRLTEGAILPLRQGAIIPPLDAHHVAMLLLGTLADVPAKDASCAAVSYYNLMNNEEEKLGEVLTRYLDSFKRPNPVAALAYRSRLELDCGYPRALLSIETTNGQLEILFGSQAKPWADIKVRRSMTISGKCLFDLGMIIHGWPERA